MMMLSVPGLALLFSLCFAAEKSRDFDSCVDKFCPPGRYCIAITASKCLSGSCRPILVCVEDKDNGCVGMTCAGGEVCVERTVSCIGRSCRKTGKCVKPGGACPLPNSYAFQGCEATVCPPSHRCVELPAAHCVHSIFDIHDVTRLEASARGGH